MITRFAIAGLGVVLGGSAVFAEATQFDGTYSIAGDVSVCIVGEGDVAGAALRIHDGVLESIESQCQLTNPTNIRDMDAILFDMVCSGEGMEWTDRVFMKRMPDQSLLIVSNGFFNSYPRCPD